MTGRTRALLAVALLAPTLALVPAHAAPGDLDPTFGSGGTVTGPPGTRAEALAIQRDRRILVGGSRVVPNTSGKRDLLVARYLDGGALDPGFGGGDGVVTVDLDEPDTVATGAHESIADLAVQADGRIVAVGGAANDTDVLVARFLADGTLDPSFGGGDGLVVTDLGGRPESAVAVALQGNRILVGLAATGPRTASDDFVLLRLDPAGHTDTTFGDQGTLATDFTPAGVSPRSSDRLADLVLDGEAIVAAGSTEEAATGRSRFAVARHGPDGEPDAAFGLGGRVTTEIREDAVAAALAVHGDGVVAAGWSHSPTTGRRAVTLARYRDDGSLDPAFGDGGSRITKVGPDSGANGVAVDEEGRILAAGGTEDVASVQSDLVVARYDAAGQPDPTFSGDGVAVTDLGTVSDLATEVAVQAGRPLLAGAEDRGLALARYESADAPGEADLAVAMTAVPSRVRAGEELELRATVTNRGPGNAYDVVLSAGELAGGSFLAGQPSQGHCQLAAGRPTCLLHGLVPGASAAVTLYVLAGREGSLVPAVSVDGRDDPSPDNDVASVPVEVLAGDGRWEAVPGFPADRRRGGHTATSLPDGRVLVAGGRDQHGALLAAVDVFDPFARTWTPGTSMGTARAEHAATRLDDGRVLVTGGYTDATPSRGARSAELYDPATGRWEPVASPMAAGRAQHTATLLPGNRVLVAGGFRDQECRLSVPLAAEVFDPAAAGGAGAWSAAGPRRFATVDHTANLLPDGRVLVVGGDRGSLYQPRPDLCPDDPVGQLAGAELFDPATSGWGPAPAPVIDRGGHSAATLADGRVLVAGGTPCGSGDCITTAAEIYDPAAGSWRQAGQLGFARAFASATLLPTGKVLIAGGQTPSASALGRGIDKVTPVHAAAEVYDPVRDSWSAAGAMAGARQGHTATVLPTLPSSLCAGCGAVLVAGGEENPAAGESDYVAIGSAELYLPAPRAGAPVASTSPPPARVLAGSVAEGGYWLVGADGGVFSFGVPFLGSTGALRLNAPVVAMAPAAPASGGRPGYWLAGADGGVFAFGAPFLGSMGGLRLRAPVVGMAPTPSGRGYWLVGADGGVFAFGDAPFRGSTGAIRLNAPVVGMAPTRTGHGYWLVAADGGVFAFGDATFSGSTGNLRLRAPVVGMAPSSAAPGSRSGYWLVAADGGVFAFGGAPFRGSTGALRLNAPVVGMAPTRTGQGYWLVASDGGVFAFGDAPFRGSTGALRLNRPVVGMAAPPP